MSDSRKIVGYRLAELPNTVTREWDSLADRLDINLSLHSAWASITARSHEILQDCDVHIASEGHETVAVIANALHTSRVLGLKLSVLGLLTNRASYHNLPICRLDPRATLELLTTLARHRNADILHFAGIPDDSTFGKYLKSAQLRNGAFMQRITGESSPYMKIDCSWATLVASKSKKFRYKLRKRKEFLDGDDDLSMKWYTNSVNCIDLLQNMEIVESTSWKNDAGISIFARNHEQKYYDELLPYLSKNNAMFANVLFHKKVPIAYNLCCVWRGWVGQMKTSFSKEYSDLSPGGIVIDEAINHAIGIGAKEFDFLGNADPHKLAWTKDTRNHTNYYVYLNSSLKGRLIGRMKQLHERLRRKL